MCTATFRALALGRRGIRQVCAVGRRHFLGLPVDHSRPVVALHGLQGRYRHGVRHDSLRGVHPLRSGGQAILPAVHGGGPAMHACLNPSPAICPWPKRAPRFIESRPREPHRPPSAASVAGRHRHLWQVPRRCSPPWPVECIGLAGGLLLGTCGTHHFTHDPGTFRTGNAAVRLLVAFPPSKPPVQSCKPTISHSPA